MTKFNSSSRALLGATALAVAGLSVFAGTPAFASTESSNFSITMSGTNSVQADGLDSWGDDDGGSMAVTANGVIVQDDNAAKLLNATTLDNPADVTITDQQGNALVNDLSTNTAYAFEWNTDTGISYSALDEIGADGTPTSTVINLSEVVNATDKTCVVMASGWSRIALWDKCANVLYDIDLPSGDVTTVNDINPVSTWGDNYPYYDNSEADSYDDLGVVEYQDGVYSIVAAADNSYESAIGFDRYVLNAPFVARDVVFAAASTNDTYKFTLDCNAGRWYGYSESGQVFADQGSTDESLFAADATCTHSASSTPAAKKKLANTGSSDAYALIGAAMVLAGAAAVRRRKVNR
jgi:LPXTG-motif cell wall-anchored protein